MKRNFKEGNTNSTGKVQKQSKEEQSVPKLRGTVKYPEELKDRMCGGKWGKVRKANLKMTGSQDSETPTFNSVEIKCL